MHQSPFLTTFHGTHDEEDKLTSSHSHTVEGKLYDSKRNAREIMKRDENDIQIQLKTPNKLKLHHTTLQLLQH